MAGAVLLCRHRERGDIGACFGFGQCEGGDGFAFAHSGEIAPLDGFRSEQRDCAGAEALHGKREIGEAVAIAENFARETQRADIEGVMAAAIGARHDCIEELSFAEGFHACAACRVDIVVMRQCVQGLVGPARKLRGITPVRIVEERPAAGFVEHISCPRIPVFVSRQRRGRRGRNPRSACTAPAQRLPPRLPARPTSPIPFQACAWSWH